MSTEGEGWKQMCPDVIAITAVLLTMAFVSPPRVPSALPGRVLHQKHERGRDAGQRGSRGLPGGGQERVAARASQRHQHHISPRPRRPRTAAHQQPERRVRAVLAAV